jgi:hypothetical protein
MGNCWDKDPEKSAGTVERGPGGCRGGFRHLLLEWKETPVLQRLPKLTVKQIGQTEKSKDFCTVT